MKPKTTPQKIINLQKKHLSAEKKVQYWQQHCQQQQLSGEFALALALGERAYDEEQIQAIANLYGR